MARIRGFAIDGAAGFGKTIHEIPKDVMVKVRNIVIEKRAGKHDVYWGCHACWLPKGHSYECHCSCGAIPEKWSICWGDDFEGYTPVQLKRRMRLIGLEEQNGLTEVITDLSKTLVEGVYKRELRGKTRRIKRTISPKV